MNIKELTSGTNFLASPIVASRTVTSEANAREFKAYIVPTGATGAWATQDGKIAYFDQIWRFITPLNGYQVLVDDENKIYAYQDNAWATATVDVQTKANADYFADAQRVLVANNCSIANNYYTDTFPIKVQRTPHRSGPTGYWLTEISWKNAYFGTNQESNGFFDINLKGSVLIGDRYDQCLFDGSASTLWRKEWGEAVGELDMVFIPPNTDFFVNAYMEAADAASHLITFTGVTRGATTIISYSGVAPVNGDTIRINSLLVTGSGTVTGVTNANPCVVTSVGHGLTTDQMVTFASVGGTTQLNGNNYRVTVLTADTFSLRTIAGAAVNSTAYGTFTTGGTFTRISEFNYADNGSVAYKVANLNTDANTFEITTTGGAAVVSTNYAPYASGGQSLRVYNWPFNFASPAVNGNGCGYISQTYANRADYTMGVGLPGGILAATVLPLTPANTSGGAISTATKGRVGSAPINGVGALYAGAPSMSAYYGVAGVNQPGSEIPGTTAASGYASMSGSLVSSLVVSSGGSGHDDNMLPQFYLGGGSSGAYGTASQSIWGPAAIIGIPEDPSVKSVLLVGDSIPALGQPDLRGNSGPYELALDNLCGVMKLACNGDSAVGWLQNYTNRVQYITDLINRGLVIDVAAVLLGANDFSTQNYSDQVTRTANNVNTIMGILETAGVKGCISSTVTPRVTGTYTSLAGQTAYSVNDGVNPAGTENYGANGRVITYNLGIRTGTLIPRQKGYVDLAITLADATDTYRWRVDGQFILQYSTGVAFSSDGVHPNVTAGTPYARRWLDISCFGISKRLIANSNFKAGRTGEVIKATLASGSAVSLVTDTDKTVLSVALPEGVWDVTGKTTYVLASATASVLKTGISQKTNSHGAANDNYRTDQVAFTSFSGEQDASPPMQTITVPKGKVANVYLIARSTFTGTETAYGVLAAKRVASL